MSTKPLFSILLLAMASMSLFVTSCRKDDDINSTIPKVSDSQARDVITRYNEALLEVERYAAGYRPCPVTTVMAYSGFAMYEAALPGMPNYQTIMGKKAGVSLPVFDATKEYNWPLVISSAQAFIYKAGFPGATQTLIFQAAENELQTKYSQGISNEVIQNSLKRGRDVAEVLWNYLKTDSYAFQAYLRPTEAYNKLPGNGIWEPTFPNFQAGHWTKFGVGVSENAGGGARLFAISPADRNIPAPIPYSEDKKSVYYLQALENYNTVESGTEEDKWVAEFWSDDLLNLTFSPPVRMFAIASQVYNNSDCNLEKALITNTKIGVGLSDASNAVWYLKWKYQVERPVTYIRKVIDPNWKTILSADGVTPPFAAYPSGHSTFGAVAAEVLTDEFGTDFAFTDRCHEGRVDFRGYARTFPNFYSFAEENAESRIKLGVHWRMDCTEGLKLGYRIGRKVNQISWTK